VLRAHQLLTVSGKFRQVQELVPPLCSSLLGHLLKPARLVHQNTRPGLISVVETEQSEQFVLGQVELAVSLAKVYPMQLKSIYKYLAFFDADA